MVLIMRKYNIAIVGINHPISRQIISLFEERNFPVNYIKPTVTGSVQERYLPYDDADYVIDKALPSLFRGMDFVFFIGEEKAQEELSSYLNQIGAVIIDNCLSARENREIPLIVPEVNSGNILPDKKIYATPSVNSIFLAMVLKPIYNRVGLRKVVVSVAQCAQTDRPGWGKLANRLGESISPGQSFPFDVVSWVGKVNKNNYTDEEIMIGEEVKRVIQEPKLVISSTVFKIPTFRVNCLSVNIETRKKITADEVRTGLFNTKGIKVIDDRENLKYPTALMCEEKDEIYVGRVRENPKIENCIDLFICGDVLRKGSALNMVQIAEEIIKRRTR